MTQYMPKVFGKSNYQRKYFLFGQGNTKLGLDS